MQINGIHHVAIICSDYEQSKWFYTELLGFTVIAETYRADRDSYKLDLDGGQQVRLELFSFPHPPQRVSNPEACGLRHLALKVDDFASTIADLRSRHIDVEPVRVDELTGKRFTFIKDPDDLPLEIYEN